MFSLGCEGSADTWYVRRNLKIAFWDWPGEGGEVVS